MKIPNIDAAFDVAGIGSALLDFTVSMTDADLETLGLAKGGMQLIDEDRSREILAVLDGREMLVTPGGSSANTLAGVANLGGTALLFARVGNDANGDRYIRDTEKTGVTPEIGRDRLMTGHAITFITPDSERSFATHLGAALEFSRDDVREDRIRDSKILHLEGYLFEPTRLREASFHAIEIAKRHGVLVSVDLSDPHLIGRIRNVFDEVVEEMADIVFCNEDEARAFTDCEPEKALESLAQRVSLAVVKLGAGGSLVAAEGSVHRIAANATTVVNTNGAGDMYAAGVLYGIAKGLDAAAAGRLGSYTASLVVASPGARLPAEMRIDQRP